MIQQTLLHLSLIPRMSAVALKRVSEQVLEHGADIYTFSVSDFRTLGIPEEGAQKLVEGLADQALFDREYDLIEKTGTQITTLADPTYPTLLFHTYAPPPALYWKGEPVWNNGPALSVVGSREGTAYGKRALDTILIPCLDQGMIIISGGARGIDAMAHELTLEQGGVTVAVFGTGLLRPYPSSNKELFEKIVEYGGAVVSCFPLEADGEPWRFPVRNRIIAGMSRGCLVAQAAQGSGALITARYALEEGRNVYAVPGPFDDPLSAGCHEILQEGAQLTVSAEVILRDYPSLSIPLVEQTSLFAPEVKKREKRPNMSEKPTVIETGIIALCARPISLDELVEQTGKTENELKAELFDLQLAGKVQQDFVGLWSKIR